MKNRKSTPSIFAVAVVFGGISGMSAASVFGIDAGGGFIVGSSLLFVFLAVAAALSRDLEVFALAGLLKGLDEGKPARKAALEAFDLLESLRRSTYDGDKTRRP